MENINTIATAKFANTTEGFALWNKLNTPEWALSAERRVLQLIDELDGGNVPHLFRLIAEEGRAYEARREAHHRETGDWASTPRALYWATASIHPERAGWGRAPRVSHARWVAGMARAY